MSAVEEKKQERTKAKQQVTTASRRLTRAVDRGVDIDILTVLMVELEKAFDDFCIIDEEYEILVSDEEHAEHEIVNGLDLTAYRANVSEVYTGARNAFVQAKAAKTTSVAQLDLVPPSANPPTQDGNTTPSEQGPVQTAASSSLSQTPVGGTVSSVSSQNDSVAASVSNVQATDFHGGAGPFIPSQPPFHQPTATHVYPGHTMNVFPYQPVSYAMPTQANNLLTGLGPISHTGYSMPPSQHYFVPMPSFQQSIGGQPYPGQQVNPSPHHLSNSGVADQSEGAVATGVHLKKMTLPIFSGQRKDWPEFKTVWKQLAEGAYKNKTALAHELKRSVKGEASQRIKSVYVTKPEAYDTMWKKLEDYYDDTSATVQAALEDLHKLKPVSETDYRGLVEFVDVVESSYSQLEELDQLNTLTMRDVDYVNALLPNHLRIEWIRKYHDMSQIEKLQPFKPFMKFLEREREAVARLAEYQPRRRRTFEVLKNGDRGKGLTHHGTGTSQGQKQFYQCAFHKRDTVKHKTSDCKEFQKLPISGEGGKFELLKQVNACFVCFGNHPQQKCPSKKPCPLCGSEKHHFLLCKSGKKKEGSNTTGQDQTVSAPRKEEDRQTDHCAHAESASHATRGAGLALYPIQQAKVCESGKNVTIFCDGGSNTTYITHQAADRIKAKKLNRITLDVTTMGNVEKTYNTRQYQFTLRTNTGKKVGITAFGMDRITGPVSKLDTKVLANLFPGYDVDSLQRKTEKVDILLGCDYFGLFPKCEEAKCGDNLSIMKGDFGVCLQGTHPDLREGTEHDSNLVKTIHNSVIKHEAHYVCHVTHPEFQPNCSNPGELVDVSKKYASLRQTNVAESLAGKNQGRLIENFICGEEIGTEITPRCGSCRCGKCPTVGHTYSFKEEQELKLIQGNLEYDGVKQCWVTSYPWLVDPGTLPNNYSSALATLKSTERTLSKDERWAETYQKQMEDMVERGVARKLSQKELQEWSGPKFYISHLAVVNTRSHSTPVRIVFNSSQVCQGMSLNSCLAKGPDCYMNNLIGILLRWREEQVALVGDIRKMFHSIHLKPLEQHCHRFLWRDLETDQEPDVYVMTRVNMGDTPAPAISTEAMYKTADMFETDSPKAANLLKRSSYVDDLIDSQPSTAEALTIARETEDMLAKGGFAVKCWQFTGESSPRTGEVLSENVDTLVAPDGAVCTHPNMLKGTDSSLRVLGLGWNPVEDTVVFEVTLNFSKKKKGTHIGPCLKEADLPQGLPLVLTRRIVLSQVMMIFDPLGFVCPYTLLGKIHLRETWSLKLGWDDPLPIHLRSKWVHFFCSLFQLEQLRLGRCLRPPDSVGRPWLIIFSDGSDLAYGFAAYIRWRLNSGDYWCRLIMAKCRIAPVNKLSTPQMELNAAVLSKRGRKVIEKEMRLEFEEVWQIVDSETVLSMINKTSTRFKVYEGVRIGEIQAATNGDMSCWAWMSGYHNPADWLTRGRTPEELNQDSHWWNGPPILYKPVEEWGLKSGLQKEEALPGEKKMCSTAVARTDPPLIVYERFRNINRVIWVVARLKNIARNKTFSAGNAMQVTAQHLKDAEDFVVKNIQKTMECELKKSSSKKGHGGRYAKLKPVQYASGIWVVGERLTRYNAMTPDSSLQRLLPSKHPATRLFMERAHQAGGHRGRDATLARFRMRYWTPQGSKLARLVKMDCQLCKLRDAKFLEQPMGLLPEVRLKPAPAFNHVMLDLFGPYTVRGEVQKRTSGKAYGVLFTDLAMRAVHIEAVFGYDTSNFLMALSRFASLRGWPEKIYSDPGSQLVGAERELKEAWQRIDRESLQRDSAQNGLTWVFGPADSPWHQGAVESLIKAAKRAIHFSVSNQRLSVPEFLTVCCEVSNLLNERPIGVKPSVDSTINVLTPNSLLLGRATASNPLGWQPYDASIVTRYHLVQSVVEDFWKRWTELYAPALVVQRKWHTATRNLCPGDVVIVADKNTLRGDYRLALVQDVFPGEDGKVRKVTVKYKSYRTGEKVHEYRGARDTVVSRAVQRLALVVPVD